MIRLRRSVVVVPANWSQQVQAAFNDHTAFVKLARSFEKLPLTHAKRTKGFRAHAKKLHEFKKGAKGFPETWVDVKASAQLSKMTDGHCAYCQTDAESGQFGEVEHYRPKSKFPLHTYRWENWFYACRACNTLKGNKWPTRGGWVRPDDAKRDPSKRFVFLEDGTVRAAKGDVAAAQTIRDFGLNRAMLVKRRKMLIEKQLSQLELHREAVKALRSRKGLSATEKAVIKKLNAAARELKVEERSVFGVAVRQCVRRAK